MTHEQYFKAKNAIARTYDTGRFPTGITTVCEFRDFEDIFTSYMEHKQCSTISAAVATACGRYGIPIARTGIGWSIKYISE